MNTLYRTRWQWWHRLLVWGCFLMVCVSGLLVAPAAPVQAQPLVCPLGTPAPPTPAPPPPCDVVIGNGHDETILVTIAFDSGDGLSTHTQFLQPGGTIAYTEVARLSYIQANLTVELGGAHVPLVGAGSWDRVVIEQIASENYIYVRYNTEEQGFEFDIDTYN